MKQYVYDHNSFLEELIKISQQLVEIKMDFGNKTRIPLIFEDDFVN